MPINITVKLRQYYEYCSFSVTYAIVSIKQFSFGNLNINLKQLNARHLVYMSYYSGPT